MFSTSLVSDGSLVCRLDVLSCCTIKYNNPLHLWENTKQKPVAVAYFIAGNKNEIKVKHLFFL